MNLKNEGNGMDPAMTGVVTPEHLGLFKSQGFFVLKGVVGESDVEKLRSECDRYIALVDADMDRRGVTSLGITHKRSRYFISNKWVESQVLRQFLFGPLMREITTAILGEAVYLFNEQFVVKFPEKGMKFGWHQDSGYIGHPHRPYMSCWIALDPVSEESGTVFALPYAQAGTRTMVAHNVEEGTNDMIGYRGDEKGLPVEGPAGTVMVFSSTLFHRSGVNTSPRMRRVYLLQYSAEPLTNREGTKLWNFAEPFPGTKARAVRM